MVRGSQKKQRREDNVTFRSCLRKARGAMVQIARGMISHKDCKVATALWKRVLIKAGLNPNVDIPTTIHPQMLLLRHLFGKEVIPDTSKEVYNMYLTSSQRARNSGSILLQRLFRDIQIASGRGGSGFKQITEAEIVEAGLFAIQKGKTNKGVGKTSDFDLRMKACGILVNTTGEVTETQPVFYPAPPPTADLAIPQDEEELPTGALITEQTEGDRDQLQNEVAAVPPAGMDFNKEVPIKTEQESAKHPGIMENRPVQQFPGEGSQELLMYRSQWGEFAGSMVHGLARSFAPVSADYFQSPAYHPVEFYRDGAVLSMYKDAAEADAPEVKKAEGDTTMAVIGPLRGNNDINGDPFELPDDALFRNEESMQWSDNHQLTLGHSDSKPRLSMVHSSYMNSFGIEPQSELVTFSPGKSGNWSPTRYGHHAGHSFSTRLPPPHHHYQPAGAPALAKAEDLTWAITGRLFDCGASGGPSHYHFQDNSVLHYQLTRQFCDALHTVIPSDNNAEHATAPNSIVFESSYLSSPDIELETDILALLRNGI